mgnify:CR=1 FL=1
MSAITQLGPQSFAETLQLAEIASKSGLVPPAYRGKVQDIIIAIQKGAEVGLSPLQSLDSISMINGKPVMWGDAPLAVCMAHASFVDIKEWWDNKDTEQAVAHCKARRMNKLGEVSEYLYSFSVDDAKKAFLWNNKSKHPWIQYPMRMLQMRARAFCLRAAFADVLKGFGAGEEVRDYHKQVTPDPEPVKHPALDAVVPKAAPTDSTLPGVVEAEYVSCDDSKPEPRGQEIVSVLQVPGVMTPEKPRKSKKPTNKDRCLDAIKLYKKDFEVEQEDLLEAAGIKTLEKVSNKQITWLIDTYKKLKTKAVTPAEVFGAKTPDLPPVPPVPSSGIEDAQL